MSGWFWFFAGFDVGLLFVYGLMLWFDHWGTWR